MITYQVDVLNPKADRLLRDLADMDLIALKQSGEDDGFMQVVERLRAKASLNPPTLDEITEEVEIVRKQRYAPDEA